MYIIHINAFTCTYYTYYTYMYTTHRHVQIHVHVHRDKLTDTETYYRKGF